MAERWIAHLDLCKEGDDARKVDLLDLANLGLSWLEENQTID